MFALVAGRRMTIAQCWKLGRATTWPDSCFWIRRGESGPSTAWTSVYKVVQIGCDQLKAPLYISRLFSVLFRKKAERGRVYFTHLLRKENFTSLINPKPCGHLCCCVIKGCEQVRTCDQFLLISVHDMRWDVKGGHCNIDVSLSS